MISLKNLTFRYDKIDIFKQFSRTFSDNLLCFGHNGAGKTTLLKLIAGILTPETGSILVGDKSDYCASILLDHRILFDDISLKSHFEWIKSEFCLSNEAIKAQIEQYCVENWLERKPSSLSDGERQWAALSLATVVPADIYLIDEPARSLDRARMMQLMAILQCGMDAGKRYVITAHQAEPFAAILEPFEMNSLPS